jgi:hypothetical protein
MHDPNERRERAEKTGAYAEALRGILTKDTPMRRRALKEAKCGFPNHAASVAQVSIDEEYDNPLEMTEHLESIELLIFGHKLNKYAVQRSK